MARRVLILGGGTGGTLVANRLRRVLSSEVEIVVVDADDRHLYQPGLLFVPFGLTQSDRLVRSRSRQLRAGIEFREGCIEQADLDADRVVLTDGSTVAYDVLVVASGARLLLDETDGLTGPGWGERVHTFYSLEGAANLAGALNRFDGGRLVINLVDLPVKCPVAPLEFCFLADWYLRRRGIRDRVELTYVTSLDGAFTKPTCNRALSGLLARKGVAVVTEFATGEVDTEKGRLVSYDEREVAFDLAVVVPLHGGAEYVGRSAGDRSLSGHPGGSGAPYGKVAGHGDGPLEPRGRGPACSRVHRDRTGSHGQPGAHRCPRWDRLARCNSRPTAGTRVLPGGLQRV